MGGARALQGDSETSQYALETSMDVSFSVDLIKGRAIGMPRVASPSQIMVLGQAGSLDDALKATSTAMIQWLEQDYGLSLSQAAQALGSAMHYSVPSLAGRSVGVAAKIDKDLVPTCGQHPVTPRAVKFPVRAVSGAAPIAIADRDHEATPHRQSSGASVG